MDTCRASAVDQITAKPGQPKWSRGLWLHSYCKGVKRMITPLELRAQEQPQSWLCNANTQCSHNFVLEILQAYHAYSFIKAMHYSIYPAFTAASFRGLSDSQIVLCETEFSPYVIAYCILLYHTIIEDVEFSIKVWADSKSWLTSLSLPYTALSRSKGNVELDDKAVVKYSTVRLLLILLCPNVNKEHHGEERPNCTSVITVCKSQLYRECYWVTEECHWTTMGNKGLEYERREGVHAPL